MGARTLVAGLLSLAVMASACGGAGGSERGVEVVAAFYPIAEAARQVGGDTVTVHDLTPAGVEPHDLELRPSDVGRLRSADLILYLGGGFQPALEDAIEALPSRRAVDLLDGIALRKGAEGEPTDPHVWLDPLLMTRIVERISAEMSSLAPGERTAFEADVRTYTQALAELDRTMDQTLRTCTRRELVTAHAAFGYLAARYGLEQIPISGVTPEAEPSPQRLREVAELAEEHGVTTIFFETLVDPRVAEALARIVGARTAVLNPIEGLTDEQREGGESYLTLMRANLAGLADGLGCRTA
ncbi:MAG: metal ABC transporter substrate-binding protein [Actinomycetota bacterium]